MTLKKIIEKSKVIQKPETKKPTPKPDMQKQPQKKSRFRLHDAGEALQPQPPQEWIIENLITAGSVNIFEGHPGAKKTWALFDMAVCVALGKKWLDFETTQGTVLIIDEESGNRRLSRRMGDVFRGHLVHKDKIMPPIKWTSLDGINLGNKGHINDLGELIQTVNARLVIIDALIDVMPGVDENSAKETQPIFANLRYLVENYGVTIIVIHHLNKGGNTRGSTQIIGAVDLIIQVESKDGNNLIKFTTTKERDIARQTFHAQSNFSQDQFWLVSRDAPEDRVIFNASETHILKYLYKHGESEKQKIIDTADSSSVKNCFQKLTNRDLIKRTDEGGQGKAAFYDLTPKGKDHAKNL
jgi:predicted ATP-dependent serine protease